MLLKLLILLAAYTSVEGDFMGRLCGTQWGKVRYYPSSGTQVQECINYCHKNNYKWAGLIFGEECFCDNNLGGDSWSYPVCAGDGHDCPSNCTQKGIPCGADPTMVCGDTFWHSLYNADTDWDIITHWETIVSDVCSQNEPNCTWYCKVGESTYEYPTGLLYGTNVYGIHSSYCLAAAHDLRYEPNVLTEVVIARTKDIVAHDLEGSWRYGINSDWKSTVDVFDVIKPDRSYNFGTDGLWGFGNVNNYKISCATEGTATNEAKFLSTLTGITQHDSTGVDFPGNDVYYCGLNQTNGDNARFPAGYVPVVTEPQGHQSAVAVRTITAEVGDKVSFTFTVSGLPNPPFHVMKQNKLIAPESTHDIVVDLGFASLPHAGFYHLMDGTKSRSATVRLIVLDAGTKTACGGFRGVLREDGHCMCFPPFGNSSDCTGICHFTTLDGQFGNNCEVNCGVGDNCKGVVICGEDPFGCQCASGWTGTDCTTECPVGTWGPNCQGHATGCHCINAETCDRITGACPHGCEWGWYGVDCQKQGPYMKVAPRVIAESFSCLTVEFDAWVQNKDGGDFAPTGYYLEYKVYETPDYDFKNSSHGIFVAGSQNYTYQQCNLRSQTEYVFRVRTVYAGIEQPIPSPKAYGTTTCNYPSVKPQNLHATSSAAREVTVTWDWPQQSDWNCDSISIVCDSTIRYGCGPKVDHNSFTKKITSYTAHGTNTVSVPSWSKITFDCYYTNPAGKSTGGSSPTSEVEPKVGPPGVVTSLACYSPPEGVLCTWVLPSGEDGHIQYYDYKIGPQGGTQVAHNVTGGATSELTTGLSKFTTYTITVSAVAAEGEGPSESKTYEWNPSTVSTA